MSFKKYLHLEKLGNKAVQGILDGECSVFPKIDGANASVWYDGDTESVSCGSRNRELDFENDNAGFFKYVMVTKNLIEYCFENETHILYGEWLVPHTIKSYKDEAWREFYVFDVYDREAECFLPFDKYSEGCREFGLNIIYPIATLNNPSMEQLNQLAESNNYLMQEGLIGEGITIKNYEFVNKFGDYACGKLLSNNFKVEKVIKSAGSTTYDKVENEIVDSAVDLALVDKAYGKIVLANDGWENKCYPRLFETVYKDVVCEELYSITTTMKKPIVDLSVLYRLTVAKIKEVKPELF